MSPLAKRGKVGRDVPGRKLNKITFTAFTSFLVVFFILGIVKNAEGRLEDFYHKFFVTGTIICKYRVVSKGGWGRGWGGGICCSILLCFSHFTNYGRAGDEVQAWRVPARDLHLHQLPDQQAGGRAPQEQPPGLGLLIRELLFLHLPVAGH